MEDLTKKKCQPCEEGTPPLEGEKLEMYLNALDEEWILNENGRLERMYKLENFQQVLDLTNMLGAIAEEEGHHPVLQLSYSRLKVFLWTHKIKGLSDNDFILAAKFDQAALQ